MDKQILDAFMKIATANGAVLADVVDTAVSSNGETLLLKVADSARETKILFVTTQVPPLAASLLQAFARCVRRSDGRQLQADMPHLSAMMHDRAVQADGVQGMEADGRVRLVFDVAGAPFCFELEREQARVLAQEILAGCGAAVPTAVVRQ